MFHTSTAAAALGAKPGDPLGAPGTPETKGPSPDPVPKLDHTDAAALASAALPSLNLRESLLGTDQECKETIAYHLHHAVDVALAALYAAEAPVGSADADHAPEPVQRDVDTLAIDQPLPDLASVFDELERVWLNRAVFYHHPQYLSHLNCPISTPAAAGDIVAGLLNTAVESWDQATTAAAIEQRLIGWMAGLAGFGDSTRPDGVFTSGGTQSNLQALTVARNKALARTEAGAPRPGNYHRALSRIRFLATGESHYSVVRAADLLGLGPDGVVDIPTNASGSMDPEALAATCEQLACQDLIPAAIIATAGTTDRGAIDPIEALADVARRHGAHLHVDAAYGGALLCHPTGQRMIDGVGRADSITIDFHKGFYQPVACSAVVFRTGSDLGAITHHADYLNPGDSPRLNLADRSLQTTRRFDALKLWVTLRRYGTETFGDAMLRCRELAEYAAARVARDDHYELFESPQLSTVLFRPACLPDAALEPLRTQLFDSGILAVASTIRGGRKWLKFTVLDPSLAEAELDHALDAVSTAAQQAADRARTASSEPTAPAGATGAAPATNPQEGTHR